MFDLLSTLFSEVQRESHLAGGDPRGHDRATYAGLLGDGADRPARSRRRARRRVRAVLVLVTLGGALFWLSQLLG
jgi:hypothetical protein